MNLLLEIHFTEFPRKETEKVQNEVAGSSTGQDKCVL